MNFDEKIYVAGHLGMVGSAIVTKLSQKGFLNIDVRTRAELDLTNQKDVHNFLKEESPDYVVIAAAKVGGIHANNNYPAEFIYQNLMIEINLIHGAYLAGVNNLLFLGSSCIYPKESIQPIQEEYLLNGILEPTNEPYAISKITGIKLCESYNRQYGTDYRSVMPTNLYGPNDNFQDFTSHVVPAIIKKIWNAKINSKNMIELWGDGTPTRDFLYVDDAASGLILAAEKYDSVESVNLGTGIEISIQDVAKLIMEIMDINLEIKWNKNMPNGQQRRCVDISKAKNELGFVPKIDLKTGLSKTIDWFTKKQTE